MAGGESDRPGGSEQSGRPLRVFILDDHELLRRGLRDLLDDAGGFEVVGESGSAQEAIRRILALRPQVALLDVQLPDGSGIDVCRHVRAHDPSIRALMVTTYADEEARTAAVLAGASGFVLKEIRGGELTESVRRVAAGESLLVQDPDKPRRVTPGNDPKLASLTPQELRILDLIVDGLTNREIAARLGLSEKTVKNYVSNVLGKLGFGHRTQAAVYGARLRSS